MAITLPSVPTAYANPKLNYKVAQEVQDELAALSWMDRAYHIARIGVNASENVTYPQIYLNDNTSEHANIRPDNEIGAYSFIEEDSPHRISINDDELRCFFSVVVWGNLDIIDNLKTYDFTSELINDVVGALANMGASDISFDDRPEVIFNKYTGVTQELKQHLMRRYTAFKVTFEIITTYTDNC